MCDGQLSILHESPSQENPSFIVPPHCLRASQLLPPPTTADHHPRVPCASTTPLTSGIEPLDAALGGGLARDGVSEWGLPPGRRGREVIIHYLARLLETHPNRQQAWCLWISPDTDELRVYPPAWMARGLNLSRMRFARTDHPMKDLKAALLSSVFAAIVLDRPNRLRPDDCAFLAAQSRAHRRHTMILRDHFLSAGRGNVWARQRLNIDIVHGDTFNARFTRGHVGNVGFTLPAWPGKGTP